MKKFILPLLCTGVLLSGCHFGTKKVGAFEQCVNELTGKQVHLYAPIDPNKIVLRIDGKEVYAVNTTNRTAAEWIGHGSLPLDTLSPQETKLVNAVSDCAKQFLLQL